MALLDPLTILSTAACLVVVWFLGKITSLLRSRQKFKHVPGPPWHPIMGHLMAIADVVQKMPQRAHPHLLMTLVMRHYNLPGVFVMDTRPAGADVTLIVADPEIARQLSESGLPKHPTLATVLEPLAGKHNLVTSEGSVWRKWRNIFNPGFSTQQVISQVPAIIECGEAFVKLLDDHAAASRVFRLEEEVSDTPS
jgi:cytochrome P450